MDAEPGGCPWSLRKRWLIAGGVVGSSFAATGLLAVLWWSMVQIGWANEEPPGNPEFGINYSCNQAEYLILEDPALGTAGYVSDARPGRAEWCAQTLLRLLDATGARHVRLSVEWSEVEPREGEYDFRAIDAQLAAAESRGARVLLSVGVRAQRHPEFYIPGWMLNQVHLSDGEMISDEAVLRAGALRMVRSVVEHVSASQAVEAWLADNEPYLATPRAHDWKLGRDFVKEEVALIRAGDADERPVVINHAEVFTFDRRWRWALDDADVVGTAIYPQRDYEVFGQTFVVDILQLGPLTPNYPARARETREAGKRFWITEMKAEPWANPDIRLYSPEHPAPDFSPGDFRRNVEYARRSGATRVYFWGAEWWLMQADLFGDTRWLRIAHDVIAGSGGEATRSAAP